MRQYPVTWSRRAETDLKEIVEYIALDDENTALKYLHKFYSSSETLYNHPDRGRIVPELKDQGITHYRELIITPWRLIYRVSETEVIVLTILDSRQNVEDILLNRL